MSPSILSKEEQNPLSSCLRNSQLTLSYTFSKYTLKNKQSLFILVDKSMISLATKTPYKIYLLGTKVDWLVDIKDPKTLFILEDNNLDKILYRQPTKYICLYHLGLGG